MRRKFARLLGNLALLSFGVFLSLLLAEGVLRAFDPLQQRLRGDQLTLPHDLRIVIKNTRMPKLDGEIVHTKNGLGFRGPDLPTDPEDHLLLFAVGGSTTECFHLGDGRAWPGLVAQRLEPGYPRLWLNNAGLDGHSTFGHEQLLEQRILKLRPQVVLFLVGVNDMARGDLRAADEHLVGPRPTGMKVLVPLARHSMLAAGVLSLERSRWANLEGLDHHEVVLTQRAHQPTDTARLEADLLRHEREYLPAYRERVRRLAESCRRAGALPIFVTQPALHGLGVDPTTGVDLETVLINRRGWNGAMKWQVLERYNDVLRDLALRDGPAVIDLARRVPKDSRLYYDFYHFTNDGADLVAGLLAPELCTILGRAFPREQRLACPQPSLPSAPLRASKGCPGAAECAPGEV